MPIIVFCSFAHHVSGWSAERGAPVGVDTPSSELANRRRVFVTDQSRFKE
jgi:hypothetical protein